MTAALAQKKTNMRLDNARPGKPALDDDLAAGDDDQGDDEQDPHHRRADAEPAGEPGADTAQDAALAWPD